MKKREIREGMKGVAPFNSLGKIVKFFKKLGVERKYQIWFFLVSMCVIFSVYAGLRHGIRMEAARNVYLEENKNIVKYIEAVRKEGEQLIVKGWSFYKGSDSENNCVEIILRNVNDKEDVIVLDTVMETRTDINEYYGGNEDYTNSGFVARGKDKKIQTEIKSYEILIRLQYFVEEMKRPGEMSKKEQTISTNRYIVDGKLTSMIPEENCEPVRTKSPLLNEVFENGKLLVYRKDADMYVYQYGKELYWIAGEKFFFEEDGRTHIGLQVETTKPECLPKGWKKGDWTGEYVHFYFEENEISADEVFPYRVAVQEIPSDYPVMCFWTGYLVNMEWVWKEFCNIDVSSLQ